MSATTIQTPNASTAIYTPDIETDYNRQNDNIFTMFRGYHGLSLTNWSSASSAAPSVEKDSVIEIGGVLKEFESEETISTGSATSGTVWVVMSASTATLYLSSTAPTWDTTLNGWYDSTLTDRYTGHVMTWDGSTSYTDKSQLISNNQTGNLIALDTSGFVRYISGGLTPVNPSIVTSSTYTSDTTFTLPSGYIVLIDLTINNVSTGSNVGPSLQVYAGSAWNDMGIGETITGSGSITTGWGCAPILSNGANYRISINVGTSSDSVSFRYAVFTWP